MKAIQFLVVIIPFLLTIFLTIKIADYHYKTYKGDYPLHIVYFLFGIIFYMFIFLLITDLFNIN